MYFDEEAWLLSTTAGVGETVPAYIVVVNLTETGTITGWNLHILGAFRGGFPGNPVEVQTFLRGGGINYWVNPGYDEGWIGFDVSFAVPHPVTAVTVLADLEVVVPDEIPIDYYTWGGWLELYNLNGNPVHGLSNNVRGGTMPPFDFRLACINCEYPPIGTEQHSWGAIKGLFR